MCLHAQSHSCVQLFVSPLTVACQASLSGERGCQARSQLCLLLLSLQLLSGNCLFGSSPERARFLIPLLIPVACQRVPTLGGPCSDRSSLPLFSAWTNFVLAGTHVPYTSTDLLLPSVGRRDAEQAWLLRCCASVRS